MQASRLSDQLIATMIVGHCSIPELFCQLIAHTTFFSHGFIKVFLIEFRLRSKLGMYQERP